MKHIQIYIVFFILALAVLTSNPAFAEKENDPLNTLDALNYAIVSIYRVEREASKVTIDEEYHDIINNIAWGNITADQELLNLFTEMMNAYTENRLEAKDRDLLRRQYEAQVNRAFLEVKPIEHIKSEARLNTAREVTGSFSLSEPSTWVGSCVKAGLGYGEYQIALQANERVRRQAQGQEQEYMQQRMAGEWELEKDKIRRFNTLKTSLMNAAWPLLNKYDIPDEARITEDNLSQFYNFISEKDTAKALRIGKRLERTFSQFPQFWFHLGRFYLQDGKIKDARACFDRFEKINRPILRKDMLAAANARYKIFTLDAHEKGEAKRLVEIVEKQSANDDWNNILFAALQSYQLGEKRKAEDLLYRNIDNGHNVPLNTEILKQIQNDRLDLGAVKSVAIREFREPSQLEKLAQDGNAEAQFLLGEMLFRDFKKKDAEKWLTKAAEQNNLLAKARLFYLQNCSGKKDNQNKKFDGFQKLASIDSDDAQILLGDYYVIGCGVEKNVERAIKYFMPTADKNNPYSQRALGFIEGARNNPEKAFEWTMKAAEQGDAVAQNNLGFLYYEGIGTAKDEKEAFSWYKKAAEQGNANAQKSLGHFYRKGIGTAKDEKEAFSWYKKAAEQGDAVAQKSLGFFYYEGIGTAKDEKEAFSWYKKAAEQGDAVAQNSLGLCYYEGIGTAKDLKLAKEWFEKSAAQGNKTAQDNIKYIAASPASNRQASIDWFDGVQALSRGNKQKAYELFQRACDGGSEAACKDLKRYF